VLEVLSKLKQLANAGAKIIIGKEYIKSYSNNKNVFAAPFMDSSFAKLGIQKDLEIIKGKDAITWSHRKDGNTDIYFIANQTDILQNVKLSFRIGDRSLIIIDPVTEKKFGNQRIEVKDHRSLIYYMIQPNQSLFFVFKEKKSEASPDLHLRWQMK
jgi:hypothetical protein